MKFVRFLILLCYYFLNHKNMTEIKQDTTLLWHKAKSLCTKLKQDETHRLRKKLFFSLASLFVRNQRIHFGRFTRPIILFEDPDARLHPRMVAIMWSLSVICRYSGLQPRIRLNYFHKSI